MRISAKARYGLACAVSLAHKYDSGEYVAAVSLSESLDISKIYLEQVFALLRRAAIVVSSKGAGGGYRLARHPADITALEVLTAIEEPLAAKTDPTVQGSAENIERAMRSKVFDAIDMGINAAIGGVTLESVAYEAEKNGADFMYYL